MRFLLNMNVPRSLMYRLTSEGHQCRHVGDIGMDRAEDMAIVREAKVRGEVIVTHDLDYGHLLAFSGEKVPSVIIFRLRNTHPNNLSKRLLEVWPEIEGALTEGAIVVIEDAVFRIRGLPIEPTLLTGLR